MSHEITIRANGFAEFAYLGESAWHGLGQSITEFLAAKGRTVESATEQDWLEAAGMDYKLLRSKVRYFADAAGAVQLEIPDQHVLMRSDNKKAMGIVSAKYKTVQPAQLVAFFRNLVADLGFKLETMGTLFDGKKYWALAKVGSAFTFKSGDRIEGYLLLATSCDGSSKTTARFVLTRVVCNNTLTAAMSEGSKHVVNLSHRTAFDAEKIQAELGIPQVQEIGAAMESLTQVKMSDSKAEDFVRGLLRPAEAAVVKTPEMIAQEAAADFARLMGKPYVMPVMPADSEKTRAPKGEAEILRLFRGAAIGSDIAGVRGTAWGMLNAVTEYVDHRASTKTDSHRMQSAWFNGGDELKTSAFEQLLAMR
jgi:phage/plasmid-like protein (TIGR03299 family)